jgi:DNA helicase-2/ATP-dependent DNA helicase PcrA
MDLNQCQKSAVLHDDGPLLIVAGAGTGKTRVVTERIVRLVNEKKALPSEILALTFTEKAASEMLERVDLEMPLGYEEFNIKTFHSFSEKILRESGLEIGLDPGFKILGQVDQWFFFKKNLFSFDLNYYRPLGNPNSFIYDLLNHFNKLRDELIKADDYIEFAKRINGEDGEKVMELALTFKKYQQLLIEKNYLDFADLTYYVTMLFDKRASVLKSFQDRFKYILVDEFQDTNYAQFNLVMNLAKNHRNIVVVGDDDQSIYKWRGASLSNILKFEEAYPDLKKIVLTENYRSGSHILDASYSLIQNNNPDRLEVRSGVDKKLSCNSDESFPVEVFHFPTFLDETSFIAEKIKSLHENEGLSYGDIAILVRSNSHSSHFVDELKYNSIPYQVKNPKGLLSLDEVKDLVALIKFLSNLKDDIAMLRLLKIDVFNVPMEDILNLLNSASKDHLFNHLKKVVLETPPRLPGTENPLESVFNLLSELINFSKDHSAGFVLNEFLNKSGYISKLIEDEKFEELENINEFAKYLAKFEKENSDNSVVDFSAYIGLLEEASAPLNYEVVNDRDRVQILTSHGAKGLEFEAVFVVNLVNNRFPVSKRRDSFEVPQELTKEIYPDGDYHIQEERRLFYVAMTRAKKRLFLTYSDQYEGNKSWKVSPFISEIEKSGSVVKTDVAPSEDVFKKLKAFKLPGKTNFDLPKFNSKKLSYSQINTFKMCPLKYNFSYLMKVPTPPSHAANFGTSIHETLKDTYKALMSGDFVDMEVIKKNYGKNWISLGYENMEHEIIRKNQGMDILKTFYEKNSKPWVIPAYIEKPFNIKIGDYWIMGRIDRIDRLSDGTFEVIDYKTGRKPKGLNLSKDLQLSVYAIALSEIFNINASSLSLYYLEDNEKVSTKRTVEQLKSVKEEISSLILEMEKSDFSPTPGYHCSFCDFRIICPSAI